MLWVEFKISEEQCMQSPEASIRRNSLPPLHAPPPVHHCEANQSKQIESWALNPDSPWNRFDSAIKVAFEKGTARNSLSVYLISQWPKRSGQGSEENPQTAWFHSHCFQSSKPEGWESRVQWRKCEGQLNVAVPSETQDRLCNAFAIPSSIQRFVQPGREPDAFLTCFEMTWQGSWPSGAMAKSRIALSSPWMSKTCQNARHFKKTLATSDFSFFKKPKTTLCPHNPHM